MPNDRMCGPDFDPSNKSDLHMLKRSLGWNTKKSTKGKVKKVLDEALDSPDKKLSTLAAKIITEQETSDITLMKELWRQQRVEGGEATEVVGTPAQLQAKAKEIMDKIKTKKGI